MRSFLKKNAFQLLGVATVLLLALAIGLYVAYSSGFIKFEYGFDKTLSNDYCSVSRPSTSGRLHVEQTHIYDENGEEVILKGVSTHGIQWFPQFVNERLFNELSTDWNANLVRIAMYSDAYCESPDRRSELLDLVKQGIDYAVESDMYVIVDWHILYDNNPNMNIDSAKQFFSYMSLEYHDVPNVIFEICNEPNGNTTWDDISEYAKQIIPIIRTNDSDSIIIVGTPDYSSDLSGAVDKPLNEYDNIMYAYHFYASGQGEDDMAHLNTALEKGVPVFVSECGLPNSDGDGETDEKSVEKWFKLVEDNHLSFTIWSLSDKEETASMIKPLLGKTSGFTEQDLTSSGKWVKSYLRQGEMPKAVRESHFWLSDYSDKIMPKVEWLHVACSTLVIVLLCGLLLFVAFILGRKKHKTYNDIGEKASIKDKNVLVGKIILILSVFCSFMYLFWRFRYSLPYKYGVVSVVFSTLLLFFELCGFIDSVVNYISMIGLSDYVLPSLDDGEYPDVDIFIATYNESADLLRKTVNGCLHLDYPDKSKVHIFLCDDNRRAHIRKLAAEMGVGYFDRPDNKGAKAGNLNNALKQTSSPYVVTLDADMIVRSNFLMKTIPYFIDCEKKNRDREPEKRVKLGLLQTPQCFYSRDVFQHNMYAENIAPNEQDFFYRTIEVARTRTNSVLYGGSNTVIAREALNDIGGFYTECITEDFATGILIESHGYVSLAISEPLASGLAPYDFREHIQQRVRWARGAINTAKKFKFLKNKNLSILQKISYWTSVNYWFSPIKNLLYLIAPLVYSVFMIPVFDCTTTELIMFWLPMYITQTLCLRFISTGLVSAKRSGIQETCMIPFLIIPVIAEAFGKSLGTFKVTNKDGGSGRSGIDFKAMLPFGILLILSVFGITRMLYLLIHEKIFGILFILFWLFRNMHYIIMSMFMCDGRPYDGDDVCVKYPETVEVYTGNESYTGITTEMNEHSAKIFLDENRVLRLGQNIDFNIETDKYKVTLNGTIVGVRYASNEKVPPVYNVEILDYKDAKLEYFQILYDRVPTLPQKIIHDIGIVHDVVKNLVKRADL
ncbi:MAG: cellulase family glycosylhydrolase [Lachnospiraceae bacterium]|nr:cellulase family glycosylhydrolase [Candidatus Colinaster equi]